ncbi:MAG TPA: hypothetical protein VEK39_04960, partial [Solirubrobacterales bacterium]|nr:hypothetical protein [Solirubrobacterales bacterium]
THGTLDAYDAATGAQLAKHPLVLGTEDPVSISFAGVSVARNTMYAAVGTVGLVNGYVVAFRKSSP